MRDPSRIDEFCETLRQKWHEVPDWRFGQLMSNFLGEVCYGSGRDIFYIEDNEMLNFLENYLKPKSK